MQRRRLLVSAAGAVAAIAATPAARGPAAPAAPGDPTVMHAHARSLMEASRLQALTESLPSWITSAAAAAADASGTERQRVTSLHARLLAIAAQTAYRTGDEGAAAQTAAAALRLADDAVDPLARAEAARVAAVVRRRAGDPAATGHMMSAADALEQTTALRTPAALSLWAETVCSTAYTASVFAALDDADALLAEARQRLEAFEAPLAFTVTDVDVFAMSAAMRAGRYDRVLARADRVDLDQVTTTHQRAPTCTRMSPLPRTPALSPVAPWTRSSRFTPRLLTFWPFGRGPVRSPASSRCPAPVPGRHWCGHWPGSRLGRLRGRRCQRRIGRISGAPGPRTLSKRCVSRCR